MVLRFRPATLEDLVADLDLLAPHYAGTKGLVPAWERLMALAGFFAAVLEDVSDPRSPRVLAHGARAFVSEGFSGALKDELGPFPGRQVVESLERGESPVLDGAGVRAANEAEGQRVAFLHLAYRGVPMGAPPPPEINEAFASAFFAAARGYRIWEFLQSVYSQEERLWFEGAGGRLCRDYTELLGPAPDPTPDHPFLLTVARDEAAREPGKRINALFVHYPARLGLMARHRELLARALLGETDDETALSLGLGTSTVKKRWREVYDYLAEHAPALTESWGGTNTNGLRGAERRRHLLNYLREHPEEMLPLRD